MSTLTRALAVAKWLVGLIARFYLLVGAAWGGYFALQGAWPIAAVGVAPLVAYAGYIAYRSYRRVPPASEPTPE